MKRSLVASSVVFAAGVAFTFSMTQTQPAAELAHKESSFDLTVNAPYSEVAPLFGAEGERVWAGVEWDPHFVFPLPARDVSGAVFTVEHGGHKQYWITPVYDLPGRHIQHIAFVGDAMINKLDITFPQAGPGMTKVHVAYARTALQSKMNEIVEHAAAQDSARGRDWQQTIDNYVARSKP